MKDYQLTPGLRTKLWYNPQNSIIYPGLRTILWYNPQNSKYTQD